MNSLEIRLYIDFLTTMNKVDLAKNNKSLQKWQHKKGLWKELKQFTHNKQANQLHFVITNKPITFWTKIDKKYNVFRSALHSVGIVNKLQKWFDTICLYLIKLLSNHLCYHQYNYGCARSCLTANNVGYSSSIWHQALIKQLLVIIEYI